MDKEQAKIRNHLKRIGSVKELKEICEHTVLSEEEKQIYLKIYMENKTLECIADEMGMSISTVKRKHSKILMRIGSLIR